MGKIWVTGDAVVDLIPDGENHYLKCAGGAPANVAVGVSRLGVEAGFIGRVGLDPLGKFMQQTLNAEKVSTEHMILDPKQRTSTVIVGLDDGERSFTFMVNPSADQFLEAGDLPTFQKGDFLHCCSIALINDPSRSTTIEAIRRIKAAGGFFSFDPNLRESLWASLEEMKQVVNRVVAMADVLKFSEEELTLLTDTTTLEQATQVITAQYPEKLIIITLGKDGAIYHLNGNSQVVAGKALKPVDTTGAGDAFVSGLLAGLSQVENWKDESVLVDVIRKANASGALATTAKGAMSALPNKAELEAFLAQ
ncbi:aminoimidazole riboside kinase [Actinobacillus pleuropneumoniae]|uniref:Aminoimidazole riboside kinase n=1 Tax=Actinobacillus pleuropneumoniae TaxID=715 RepID=A0A3S4YCB3_ACTPL|nr:aminoimidazole riboside kinase [Actinobacillus pleuropneumoniae]EFL79426.1 aminoimidazole riboside kinase [Actinobacillus pleuropneumoniae serovar 2 str. 4226]EFM86595.1 Fructokinase [Actinobacillus pleuropneumoniae serovar 2 str. S1536]MEE3618377.1 aminoimidazole riboside kinase [Actinobacillus pleuropneumoniae]UKH08314.1 aminoimidazole riboside kinase [Actinobacillus pleuropneumoniae]UKH46745.1 aminoimidazole riboside kinase [Actinobacillus pleuropneumoniae serovar 2 str. S1536]